MKVASIGGIELSYIEKGKGVTIIFIHGSLNDYCSWQFQMEAFSAQYHVVAYSRRNHFPNRWKDYPESYSVRTERDDLLEFIEALGLQEPVHLVGTSYGAFVAALFGRKYPRMTRSLVLGEPPILSLLSEPASILTDGDFERRFAQSVLGPLKNGDLEAAATGFIDSIEGEGSFNRLPSKTRKMMLQNSRSLGAELSTPERDPFSSDDARKILAPTLLVKGQQTSRRYESIVVRLVKLIPNATVATIGKSSHNPHITNPLAYNRVLSGFLSSH